MQQTDYKFPAIGAGKGFPKDGSPNGPVKQNADGTTDVYFGPKAPKGMASNSGSRPCLDEAGSPLCASTALVRQDLASGGDRAGEVQNFHVALLRQNETM